MLLPIRSTARFLLGLAAVAASGSIAQADDRRGIDRQLYLPDSRPIIVLPSEYQGLVEVINTPDGYVIRVRPSGGESPYPDIDKAINPTSAKDQEQGDGAAQK